MPRHLGQRATAELRRYAAERICPCADELLAQATSSMQA